MKIKNFTELAVSPARHDALRILEAGLTAVDTRLAISRAVKLTDNSLALAGEIIPLAAVKRIFLVAVGKCALAASLALEDILGDRLTDGVVIDVECFAQPKKVRFCLGDHPFPSEKNIDATKWIIDLLQDATVEDLIIFVVSGGGSVLLCQPENFTCQQEAEVIRCLFKAGATINELNTVRKHLSLARGGYLAKYAYPARGVSLVFSDVPGNDLNFIASGPTVLDRTTIADALAVINKYRALFDCGFATGNLLETPKDEKYFANLKNILLVTNRLALEAMVKEAQTLGYQALIKTDCLEGEAKEIGRQLAEELKTAPTKTIFLYGGETTVNLQGRGRGGRNQTLALAALPTIPEDGLLVSLASDGWDNTPHAGAISDIIVKRAAETSERSIQNYLDDDDSFSFFERFGGYLDTGRTGANVSDLILSLKT